jgi:glycosyltransferase involved in cell wall biosynthesis
MDLSVLIPARNEIFLAKTVENVLENIRADTEVIAVCDGYWPEESNAAWLLSQERVTVLHYEKSIGQRAATNRAADASDAKYIMKLDAHCAVDEGFDVKLMADCHPDWTMVPLQYNLHAFDWQCTSCSKQD